MKKILIVFMLSFCAFACAMAQNEILVAGTIKDQADKSPIKNVRVWAYNTAYEARDKKAYLDRMIQANANDLIDMEGIETQTNGEGYFEIMVSPTGGLVCYLEMSDPVEVDVRGRNQITVQMRRGALLDEAKVTSEGGPVPTFMIPESDGETIYCGATIPVLSRFGQDRSSSRLVFQTYLMDAQTRDTVLFRQPLVMDGQEYHDTQLRRMGFDVHNDPLFLCAQANDTLKTDTSKVEWRDTVSLPDPKRLYHYNCMMWMEDYNKVYYELPDTTVFRTDRLAVPMRFLEYSLSEFELDPDKYKKQPKKELRPSSDRLDLKFLVGRAEIDPSDVRSTAIVDSLRTALQNAMIEGATLREFHIMGVASPDGNFEKNKVLADRRMNYLSDQLLRGIPSSSLRYTNKSLRGRVATWDEVDALMAKGYSRDEALQHLRSVTFQSTVEIVRALSPEEILEKYNTDEDYREGRKPVSLYEYWNLFKMVKDPERLEKLYRQAYEISVKTEPWELAANLLAVSLIRKSEVDTTILAPFIDLRRPINFEYKIGSRVDRIVNVEQLVANQVRMMLLGKHIVRAGQLANRLPDTPEYHNLRQITFCIAGYWKKDAALRDDIVHTSPRNAVVMHMAEQKYNEAAYEAGLLSEEDPVTFYMRAQIESCLHGNDFFAMQNDVDENTFVSAAEKAAYDLSQAFRMDKELIETARIDYYIHEKLLELALKYYKENYNPFDLL